MKSLFSRHTSKTLVLAAVLTMAARAEIVNVSTFAKGTAPEVNATFPDSITVGGGSVWVSYANGASSTGLTGSSTVVQYDLKGAVLHKYSIPGSVDGLKIDPETGLVWALQNQDGNSTLTLIDPISGITPNSPLQYKVTSATRGYDDVVFRDGQVYLSYTNPTSPADPTIQRLENRTSPLEVSPVITMGATGTDLATGENESTSQHDPDSLKLTPGNGLMLTSGDDGQLIFVLDPLAAHPTVAFLSLLGPGKKPVSGLDDAVFPTSKSGTFYLTDTNNNRVLKIDVEDLADGSLFACVGSLNEFVRVDLQTGIVAPVQVGDLNAPHGLVFVPKSDTRGDR